METLHPNKTGLMETLHPNKTGIYIEDVMSTSQQDRCLCWDVDITSQQDRYLYKRWRHYIPTRQVSI